MNTRAYLSSRPTCRQRELRGVADLGPPRVKGQVVTTRYLNGCAVCKIALAVALCFSSPVRGSNPVWVGNGPYGGQVECLALDPLAPAVLYAGTDGAGVYKTDDGGTSWRHSSQGMWPSSYVLSLVVDPTDSRVLYAVTTRGIYRTVDGGDSWVLISEVSDVRTLAISPEGGQVLYAGSHSRGFLKSKDAGATWAQTGMLGTGLEQLSVAVDPHNAEVVYIGSFSGGAGVYRSTDAGETFAPAGTGVSEGVMSVAVDPNDPGTLYAGTNSAGLYRSTDAGATWTQTGITSGVACLAFDPSNRNVVYAGTLRGAGIARGVYKSADRGVTWTPSHNWLRYHHDVLALVVSPIDPQVLYAATNRGIIKSTDGGDSWAESNVGLAATTVMSLATGQRGAAMLYAGVLANSLFRSADGGDTWVRTPLGDKEPLLGLFVARSLAVDPTRSDVVYCGADGMGMLKSTDGGDTWVRIGVGMPSAPEVIGLAVDPANPQVVYAGTYTGVYKTTNAGASWVQTNSGLQVGEVPYLAVAPSEPWRVYAIVRTGAQKGLYRSLDAGGTWRLLKTDPYVGYYSRILVDPRNPLAVCVGTARGVLRSVDGGESWKAADMGGQNADVRCLAATATDPPVLFAGTNYQGA